MNLYYWAPFLSKVATVNSVLNSASSLQRYSKNNIKTYIINVIGEWFSFSDEIHKEGIQMINFINNDNFYRNLPRNNFFNSRISYLIIFFFSFIKLHKFLRNRKENDIIIVHLITILPLLLIIFFNFKCKFILRISGYPKMNLIRTLIWKLASKKLLYIFSPTIGTANMLIKNDIFDKKLIVTIRDPVFDINNVQICKKKKINLLDCNNYLISIGRLTNQKNHKFLIYFFNEVRKKYKDLSLLILGDGEKRKELLLQIKLLNLQNSVYLLGYKKNIFKYLKNAFCFILTSKWEDPGFVIIEAAACRVPIISSNCPNGPEEFLGEDIRGYLYKEGNMNDLIKKFNVFYDDYSNRNNNSILKLKIKNALIESRKYTSFKHYLDITRLDYFNERIC